jgi:hypothetical protein
MALLQKHKYEDNMPSHQVASRTKLEFLINYEDLDLFHDFDL